MRNLAETLAEVRVSEKKDNFAGISIAMMGLDIEDEKAEQKREDLMELRLRSEPFVDLDKNGMSFTWNTAGSFKISLILNEALMMLGKYVKN